MYYSSNLKVCLKVFKLLAFLIVSHKLFQTKRPIYEIIFYLMCVLGKRFLSLEKLFLVPILQCGVNSKISFR